MALMLTPIPALGTDVAQTTEHLYIHNAATGCADESLQFLVYTKPTTGSNCGYIYGAPANEVEHQTQQGVFGGREYGTEEGFNITLDASRNLTGTIRVSSRTSVCVSPAAPAPAPPVPCQETGQGTGVGEVIVDLVATAETAAFDAISLGSASVKTTVTPGTTNYDLPFSIDIPDALNQSSLGLVKLSVNPRGVHVHSGYADASGISFVDVPSLTPVVHETTP